MDLISFPPVPINEPNLTYAPGSPERDAIQAELTALQSSAIDLPAYIGGQWQAGSGAEFDVVQPHNHAHILGTARRA